MLVVLIRMGTLPILRRKKISDHIEYALFFVQQYEICALFDGCHK